MLQHVQTPTVLLPSLGLPGEFAASSQPRLHVSVAIVIAAACPYLHELRLLFVMFCLVIAWPI